MVTMMPDAVVLPAIRHCPLCGATIGLRFKQDKKGGFYFHCNTCFSMCFFPHALGAGGFVAVAMSTENAVRDGDMTAETINADAIENYNTYLKRIHEIPVKQG